MCRWHLQGGSSNWSKLGGKVLAPYWAGCRLLGDLLSVGAGAGTYVWGVQAWRSHSYDAAAMNDACLDHIEGASLVSITLDNDRRFSSLSLSLHGRWLRVWGLINRSLSVVPSWHVTCLQHWTGPISYYSAPSVGRPELCPVGIGFFKVCLISQRIKLA